MDKVLVAFERRESGDRVKEILESSGEFSCTVCRSGADLRRMAGRMRSGLVVCGFKLPDESCESIWHELPAGCVMLMAAAPSQLALCETREIFKLPLPVRSPELLSSVRMLAQLAALRLPPPERPQEERELVDRAKQFLMEQCGMSEEQAHRSLQKQSMDNGIRLADIARRVLDEKQPGNGA